MGRTKSPWGAGGAIAIGVVVTAAFLVPPAIWGNVDNDEGYYGLAAKLAFAGEIPYHDFFYPQAPLLPYVYGAWMQVFGVSLAAARLLSVGFAVALGALICNHAARRFGSLGVGAIAVLAFAATRLVSNWYPLAKTYALSTLLLFGAFMLLDRAASERTARRWLAAGILVGLAIDVRLIFAATVPVFLILAWRDRAAGHPRVGNLVAGLGVGLLPSLLLFLIAPSQFVFDNIGFHSVRSQAGLVGNFHQKLGIVSHVLGQPEYAVLLLLAALAVAVLLANRRPPPLAFWLAAVLGVAGFLPTPTYTQYACTTVPFVIFTALELVPPLRAWLATPRGARYRKWALAGVGVLAIGFVIEGVRGIEDQTQLNAPSGPSPYTQIKPSAVTALAREIDANTAPGERVLSFRPLYDFLSHAQPVPGFENDEAPVAAQIGHMSDADAEHLRLITNNRLEALIRSHGVRLIVAPGDSRFLWGSAGRPWGAIVRDAGYRLLGTYDGVTLWLRPEGRVAGAVERAG